MQIDEIELWNYLLKWGIAQTSELKEKDVTNLSSWNEKDFMILKNTLNQFITHIRFFEITSKDFHNKIWPFKKVLPETLFEDIVSFYLANTQPNQNKLPPRYGKIPVDSIIIKPKHAAILTNWIQRKDANTKIPKDSKYNFNLIYRGSRDDYNINTIRNKCHGQGACILIIKIKDIETIIGGYNPLSWNNYAQNQSRYYRNDYWVNNTESFIFSLGDGKDSKNFKISRISNSSYAMYESNYYNMVLNFGYSDLVINNDTGTCNQKHYESSILDIKNFTIEEMEIFRFHQS